MAAALLLRPSAGIESLPPLQSEPGAIYPRAIEQFDGLVTALRQCGVQTVVLDAPADDGPVAAATTAADLAVVLPGGAVLMRPSDPVVRAQVARTEAALEEAGVRVIGRIEAPGLLDGGDVLAESWMPCVSSVGTPGPAPRGQASRARPRGNELGQRQFAAIAGEAGLQDPWTCASRATIVRLRAVAAFVDRATVVVGSNAHRRRRGVREASNAS